MIIKIINVIISILIPAVLIFGTMIFCAAYLNNDIGIDSFINRIKWIIFGAVLILAGFIFSSVQIYEGLKKNQKNEHNM